MKLLLTRRFLAGLLLAIGTTVLACNLPLLGEEGKPAEVVKPKKPHGKLPAYYAKVVTPEQREQIIKIQKEYQPKIDALQAQLKALINERNEKIEALLTPEQKKQIEEATAAARAKRKKFQPPAEQ